MPLLPRASAMWDMHRVLGRVRGPPGWEPHHGSALSRDEAHGVTSDRHLISVGHDKDLTLYLSLHVDPPVLSCNGCWIPESRAQVLRYRRMNEFHWVVIFFYIMHCYESQSETNWLVALTGN